MSYVVFARKFRPKTFDEVVGQDAIVKTLTNAITQKRIPQNFLFSGPRGIGKTSVARILAKALNAPKGPRVQFDPEEPSLVEIAEGRSMDVLEIDGASNRGIDEIRNLRETVKFNPVAGKYKIYIIDEVHMLTMEAFNALLKTLEEPPEHVKFIFATTESHKVPLTILSRCQRFNFKRISTNEIVHKLEDISKAEKIKYDQDALFQIAKASEGALRDAESLLDQLASFSGKKIQEDDVLTTLGIASEDVYFSVLEALKEKDAKQVFSIVEQLYSGGRDLIQFGKGLLELFRNLLLIQCSDGVDQYVEMSEEGLKELKKHKHDFSRGALLLALSLMGNLQPQLRRNLAPPRLLIETTLLKLMHVDGLEAIEQLKEGAPSGHAPVPTSTPASYTPSTSSKAAGPVSTRPKAIKTAPVKAQAQEGLSLSYIEEVWPRVIDYVKAKRMSIGIFLSESIPVEIEGTVITLGLPAEFQFHKDTLEKDTNRQLIEEAFQVVSGTSVRVVLTITKVDHQEETTADQEESKSELPEIITQALDVFEGAKIIRQES